jgi:geranylgeranyl reductase family protein
MTSDVAIVGAGPAGAWAGTCLARSGARVTIFDPSHPREKVCGGGVTGRALTLVSDLLATAVPRRHVGQARFLHGGASVTVPLRAERHEDRRSGRDADLVVVSRARFDAALLDGALRAGVRVVKARVTDIAIHHDGVRLQAGADCHRASVVIGADGANSLVRRRVAGPFPRGDLTVGTGYFAHGVTSEEIVIELVADPPGYIWSFPRPDHLAIGVCAQADAGVAVEALRERAGGWMQKTGIAPGARLQPYAWPIPSLSVESLERVQLAGRRWCVVGDAAGLVDPITREGIYFALLSGQLAAETLSSSGGLELYVPRVHDQIVSELIRAARFKAGFFRPQFIRLLLRALERSTGVRAVMADLVAGRQGYQGLKRRLLATLDLGLACDLLVGKYRRAF